MKKVIIGRRVYDVWVLVLVVINVVAFMVILVRPNLKRNIPSLDYDYLAGEFIVPGEDFNYGMVQLKYGDTLEPHTFRDISGNRRVLPVSNKWTLLIIHYGGPSDSDNELLTKFSMKYSTNLQGVCISIANNNLEQNDPVIDSNNTDVWYIKSSDLELLPILRGICSCNLIILVDVDGIVKMCLDYGLPWEEVELLIDSHLPH